MVSLTRSLKVTDRVVFLKLPWEGVMQCGWLRSDEGVPER